MTHMTVRSRTRVAVLLATSVVVLAGCGTEDDSRADDPTDSGTTPTSSAPTAAPTTDAPPATETAAPEMVAVPAYFVGETPLGKRLFREFRSVEADNPVDEALALISAGDTLDPDYSTLLTGGSITLKSYDEAALVSLPDEGWAQRPDGMSAEDAKLAVQQIVYTLQGALQKRIPLQFYVGDEPVDIFGIPTPTKTQGYPAADENDVLALVNITTPEEGQTVSGTFTASGVANSFEATVPWEIRDADGKKVLDGFATAEGWMDKLYPWQTEVDVSGLAPGTYSFVALTDDPSGGEGGGPTEDSKTITVG
jgi:hypothetical protein